MSRYSLFVLVLALAAVAAFQTMAPSSKLAASQVAAGEQLVVAPRSADAVMNVRRRESQNTS